MHTDRASRQPTFGTSTVGTPPGVVGVGVTVGSRVVAGAVAVGVGRGVLAGTGADEVTLLVGVGVGDDGGTGELGAPLDDGGGAVVEPMLAPDCSRGSRYGLGVDVPAGGVLDCGVGP
jgi:hypothetical protein